MTTEQVQMARDAGAEYIVSPNMDEAVIRETKRLGMVSLPGAMTPTECVNAKRAGADVLGLGGSLFPESLITSANWSALSAQVRTFVSAWHATLPS